MQAYHPVGRAIPANISSDASKISIYVEESGASPLGMDVCERFDTPSCGFKGLCSLYKMQLSIVERIAKYTEDAER